MKDKRRKYVKNNMNVLKIILILLSGISIILLAFLWLKLEDKSEKVEENDDVSNKTEQSNIIEVVVPNKKKITDWRLILVNKENPLPKDFVIELENIDETKQFDKRAIGELRRMIQAIKNSGINNIWVQSAYRSIEYQQNLYDNKINDYLNKGVTKEEAEKLTLEYINKPGESEHNLGLAVDFNNVNNDFKNTKAFEWLNDNAKEYGFIMRYPEEKAEITGVAYEPWHWRYVGKDNAYKMEELNMCLEEYRKYLEEN